MTTAGSLQRVVRTRHSSYVSCLEIEPPLDNLKQYTDVCAAAYTVSYMAGNAGPTEADFARSHHGNLTELRFVGKSALYMEVAARRAAAVIESYGL